MTGSMARRGILGGVAATAAAGVLAQEIGATAPPPAAKHLDAELLRLCGEFHKQCRACAAANGPYDDEDHDVAHAARWAAADAMHLIQPLTDEGRAAKAGVAIELLLPWFDPGEAAPVDFVLNTLREIAGLKGRPGA